MYRGQRLRAILDRANAGAREGGFPRYGAEDVERLVDRERDKKWAKQEKEADERTNSPDAGGSTSASFRRVSRRGR